MALNGLFFLVLYGTRYSIFAGFGHFCKIVEGFVKRVCASLGNGWGGQDIDGRLPCGPRDSSEFQTFKIFLGGVVWSLQAWILVVKLMSRA